jgi:ERCC4-type nuclease
MSKLTAVIIDKQEPKWVQRLKFKSSVPTITSLHVGDAWLTTDDAQTIIVERKSANDLINSVLDDGLRNQCVRIANEQMFQWKYLIYTMPEVRGEFVVLNGQTSKIRWRHILGVLVDVQELGITCIPIDVDSEYGGTLEWIATRNHGTVKAKAHRRKGIMETQAEFFLSGLKGIQNRASMLLKDENSDGVFESAAWALDWLCNLESEFKVPGIAKKTKQNVRKQLGLADDERLGVINTIWEHIASVNQEIVIGENEGHIWTDGKGMAAIIELLSQARPNDPALKKLLNKGNKT